jgi:hypothetical protein
VQADRININERQRTTDRINNLQRTCRMWARISHACHPVELQTGFFCTRIAAAHPSGCTGQRVGREVAYLLESRHRTVLRLCAKGGHWWMPQRKPASSPSETLVPSAASVVEGGERPFAADETDVRYVFGHRNYPLFVLRQIPGQGKHLPRTAQLFYFLNITKFP